MKKLLTVLGLSLALLPGITFGQFQNPAFVFTGVLANIPTACRVGTLAFITNATAGKNIYECASTNTWTQQVSGTGTVTSVSVTTANGVSGSVATPTTTPAISLTLGAITPTTVNGNTFTTGSSTYTGTAGQTYTFPATSATLARTDSAQTFTGVQTFVAPVLGTPTTLVGTNITGTASGLTAGIATNLAGGAANNVPYQSGAGTTAFFTGLTVSGGALATVTASGALTGSSLATGFDSYTSSSGGITIRATGSNAQISLQGNNGNPGNGIIVNGANGSVQIGSASGYLFANTTNQGGTMDTGIIRSAAGELSVTTGGLSGSAGSLKATNVTASGTVTGGGQTPFSASVSATFVRSLLTNTLNTGYTYVGLTNDASKQLQTIQYGSAATAPGSVTSGGAGLIYSDGTALAMGTGAAAPIQFVTGAAYAFLEQVRILSTASASRYLTLTGSNGGSPTIGTSAGNLAISSPVDITGALTTSTTVATGCVAIGSLPAAGTAGRRMCVTDQITACALPGVAVTAGGALKCPVFDNGVAWTGG